MTRAIALYLPQFHPVPENDAWWGPGFTEWTNTAKAKPLFAGHYQPHVPADLGFYDLRVAETRQAQADLAARHGIEAFCYYHYWFAGRRILERPFAEVLASGAPKFPFCLCWANETWTGVWHGAPDRILIEQTYPGPADHAAHFAALRPAFADPRYLRVDGKPIFLLYKPEKLPDPVATLAQWRAMAAAAGLPGLHVVGMSARPEWDPAAHGFDAKVVLPLIMTRGWVSRRRPLAWLRQQYEIFRRWPTRLPYAAFADTQMPRPVAGYEAYPCLVHGWDNTPRAGANGVMLTGATPKLFRRMLDAAVAVLRDRPPEHRLLFLKAWNEWAEGNHLEPDLADGHAYLREVAAALAQD
jgi:lipopolysaccharide biosynthesis protein